MNDNFVAVVEALPVQRHHAQQLARNSFSVAFIDADLKQKYLLQVDAFFAH
jgi:adenosine deaminase